jgi:TonB family protein
MKTFLRIVGITALFAATVFFNIGLIDIRMEEMSYLLGKIAARQDIPMSLGIVAKYELIKKRMLYGEENDDGYELEAKIQALTSGDQFPKQQTIWKNRITRIPVRIILNAIRFSLGKPIINTKEEDELLKVLELGYFWERSRKYQEAIKVYDEVLEKKTIQPDLQAAVMIHKAFCHSMLSEYEVSKHIYERIITLYSNTDAGILSWKLLDFIQSMERQRSDLERKSLSDFEKAKQFYLVMDYRNAVKHYSLFLQENTASPAKFEVLFFKGRSHEELGEGEEAMFSYQQIIRDDKTRQWAKQANRRMLMMGEFYDQKRQLADQAKKQLEAYQDQGFMDNIRNYASMVSESSLRKELTATSPISAKQPAKTDDSLLTFINRIGTLDLTGENEAGKREEREKIRSELIEKGKLSAAEINELERRKALEDNPFRKPTSLKAVIDENASQLKFLYNRRLREGVRLSGKMIVEIGIKPNGNVKGVKILRSTMGDKTFEESVLAQIGRWKFKAVEDSLGDMTVNYPIEFFQEE